MQGSKRKRESAADIASPLPLTKKARGSDYQKKRFQQLLNETNWELAFGKLYGRWDFDWIT